ncbi:DUF3883 domain-containing protein [Puniceibacterium sp. IMCC21224]|uniref:DUF3883 domain-containing protein n=1 Tax=Puniceibacterium sp. IMCC21224 TaxID=1618204 RepID=UPI00065D7C91|nr:DUF3883 domain-containing protein [Puniceibacterium sp. IMCC21224]KMK66638.1 protein of unknown function (DUF3883) [Puniceibacterium sp. IMCC21224]
MDWDDVGLGARVLDWLTATGKSNRTTERRLDPFATSMRDLDDVTVNLLSVRAGEPLTHNDQVQRITDLRSAGLVVGAVDTATLTELGNATLDSWLKYDVANDSMADEFARTFLLMHEARQLNVDAYVSYAEYWAELRSSYDPHKLLDNWDALFILNYLDNSIDGFAPGSAFRDEKVPVEAIEYDLDDYAEEVAADKETQSAADQVARAIGGKIPRGKARATVCLALEIMATPKQDPRTLLREFGQPRRPRQWDSFDEKQIEKFAAIIANIGIPAGPASDQAKGGRTDTTKPDAILKLPAEINFEKVERAAPQPPKKKPRKKGGSAPKKIDHKRKQERNDIVGRVGEEFALQYEQWRLRGHPDLVEKIEHVSLEDDTKGYDIKSFELDGTDRLVEVKATQGPLETRFFMSAPEKVFADANPETYVILRVGNLNDAPVLCELKSPFDQLDFATAIYEINFLPAEDDE